MAFSDLFFSFFFGCGDHTLSHVLPVCLSVHLFLRIDLSKLRHDHVNKFRVSIYLNGYEILTLLLLPVLRQWEYLSPENIVPYILCLTMKAWSFIVNSKFDVFFIMNFSYITFSQKKEFQYIIWENCISSSGKWILQHACYYTQIRVHIHSS